ncbi:MAG TPA: HEAT repeat domain-containing protein [Terriglobales bacterium]|nr:HEAT repeat domain-containing protein [Terriglobales bacterium]
MTQAAGVSSTSRACRRVVAAAAVLLCGPFAAAQARQPTAPVAGQVQSLGRQMASPAVGARMAAFYDLLRLRAVELPRHPELNAEFNLALIRGLAAENEFERQANAKFAAKIAREGEAAQPDHPDSAEGNYCGDIIQAVAALNDPRALPVLLDDIQTGNGAAAAIARYGARAFPRLEALTHASSPGSAVCIAVVPPGVCVRFERESALDALAIMAAPAIYQNLGPALGTRLQWLLRSAAHLQPFSGRETIEGYRKIPPGERTRYVFDENTRTFAIRGLANIRSPLNDSLVEDHAERDPAVGVRTAAIFAIAQWREPSTIPLLRRIFSRDPNASVREQARIALKNLGAEPAKRPF